MIEEIIKKAKNKKVYVYAHKFPDGDAISSSCAVVEYLSNQGIDARYVVKDKVRSFSNIVGEIPITTNVERAQISIILDTTTENYAENTLFKNSTPEDTYIIDHHKKEEGTIGIEDELGIPDQNVIRDPDASSVCEILVNDMEQNKMNSQVTNMLTLGLLTDTARLKFLKPNTLKNLSKLIELGADYEQIIKFCMRKSNLKNNVGLARAFLSAKKFPIGDTFGIILPINNRNVDNLNRTYGVRSPQKKIFKMADIENCSFTCIFAENNPGKYDVEFRSTKTYGDFDVLQLANLYNGGGHLNASGCIIKAQDDYSQSSIESELIQKVLDLYSNQATNLPQITLNKQDKELSRILDSTKRLTRKITPEILTKVDELVKQGVNYDYAMKTFKSFETFMLENEILSRIPYRVYSQQQPYVKISLLPQEVDKLSKKYNVSEEQILETINLFSDIHIQSATIILPNGKSSHINRYGNITMSEKENKKGYPIEITQYD